MPIFREWTEIVRVARSAHLTTLLFAGSSKHEFVQIGLGMAISVRKRVVWGVI